MSPSTIFSRKKHTLATIILTLLPVLLGSITGFLANLGTPIQYKQPAFAPPKQVFPIVWTILYVLMGIASSLIFKASPSKERKVALWLYTIQLIFNFGWSFIFFTFGLFTTAFGWLVALWGLIAATVYQFFKLSKPAGLLLIPYLLWVTFAGILNFFIARMN